MVLPVSLVFVPNYRYRVLKGDIGKYVYKSIYAHTERSGIGETIFGQQVIALIP